METPNWFDRSKIKTTLDARPILASGDHPLERVVREAAMLHSGEIYEILTPFPPAPMIEKLQALLFESYMEKDGMGLFHTYFRKP